MSMSGSCACVGRKPDMRGEWRWMTGAIRRRPALVEPTVGRFESIVGYAGARTTGVAMRTETIHRVDAAERLPMGTHRNKWSLYEVLSRFYFIIVKNTVVTRDRQCECGR